MTTDHTGPRLITGGQDPELAAVLDAGLDEYNFAATGTSKADQGHFSVKVLDEAGEIVGGLTAWYWAGLCGIGMLLLPSARILPAPRVRRHRAAARSPSRRAAEPDAPGPGPDRKH